MFIFARSEQCELGLIYTISNTQRIRIYPGKFSDYSKKKLQLQQNMFKNFLSRAGAKKGFLTPLGAFRKFEN